MIAIKRIADSDLLPNNRQP